MTDLPCGCRTAPVARSCQYHQGAEDSSPGRDLIVGLAAVGDALDSGDLPAARLRLRQVQMLAGVPHQEQVRITP